MFFVSLVFAGLNSAQIIVPVSKRQMLRMSDVVELKNLVK